MENNTKSIKLIALIIATLVVVGGIVYFLTMGNQDQSSTGNNNSDSNTEVPEKTYTEAMLAEGTGKGGKECLVAVDGTVYMIEESENWKDGEHVNSEGKAKCGEDLTEVIKGSPHGKSVLLDPSVTAVGKYNN